MTGRSGKFGLAVMAALAGLWLVAASRVHVNASWSDEAWGYAAVPLFGEDPGIGDRVLFDPPEALGAPVPWLKTVRGHARHEDAKSKRDGTVTSRRRPPRPGQDPRSGRAAARGHCARDDPAEGHYFLHADHVDSHDSRYAEIGLVPRARILGRAVALPDLPWLGLEGPLVGPEDGR